LYFNNKSSNRNNPSKVLVLKVFLASFFYGVLIEIAQSLFTTTRKGDVLDVIANTTGALGAVSILVLWGHYFTNKDIQIK
jgi:VanZ family protein